MPGEEGGLVDDAVTDLPACKNRSRMLATSARVEIVTVEVEQHDARPFDPLEQRIEAGRIETPRIVKLVEIAERRWRCRHYRVHILGGIGCHQGEKRTKRLAGEHNATIAFTLQLTHQLDQPPCTACQSVPVPPPLQAQPLPPPSPH